MKNGRRLRRRWPLWGLLAVLEIAGGGFTTRAPPATWLLQRLNMGTETHLPAGTLEQLGVYGEVPDFAPRDQSNRPITRSALLGKIWLADVIYTHCEETCPLQSAVMAQVQAAFVEAEDLRSVSITVDPERDTPEVLSRYGERYGAHPDRWLLLSGERQIVSRLIQDGFRLGVMAPQGSHQTTGLFQWLTPRPALATHEAPGVVMHSSRFVLVDRQAHIRAYHWPDDAPSLTRLRQNLTALPGERPHGA